MKKILESYPIEQRNWYRRQKWYWLRLTKEQQVLFTKISTLKEEKKLLYQMIISQLLVDGFSKAALILIDVTKLGIIHHPDAKLYEFFSQIHGNSIKDISKDRPRTFNDTAKIERDKTKGVDFDIEREERSKINPNYATRFVTTHKNGVRCAAFSYDGKFVATGSSDTSIKLLDVLKMETYSQQKNEPGEDLNALRPVIRTFYDHNQPVNDLAFHPSGNLLISASKDNSIKFFEYASANKRSNKQITDTHNVRSVAFHPSGDFILTATDHYLIRLYDINTGQAYIGPNAEDHHYSTVNQARYSPEGKFYVSCGKDGAIKVWDGISNRCVRHIPSAHSGAEVSSVQFSRNSKYILSGGKDSIVRLWDVTTGRQITSYSGAVATKNRLQTIFCHNEDYIVTSDESSNAAIVWDTRTGEVLQKLTGHNGLIRWIAASPAEPALISCSDDHRARFWTAENLSSFLLSAY